MKDFFNKLDPYHQSALYFRWSFWPVFCMVWGSLWLYAHARDSFCKMLLDNMFVYLPNYLIHEFSHRFWCAAPFWSGLNWHWLCYASGNGAETLLPLLLCFGALRLAGGRYMLPPILYWLSTTLYGAGIYASDARAMKLPLTSSDMMSNFAPGEVKGDWHYILEPLGLLDYDVMIGNLLILSGMVCFVLAIYSFVYYWTNTDQYIGQRRWD